MRRLHLTLVVAPLLACLSNFALAASYSSLESIVIYPQRTAPATTISLNNSSLSSQIQATVKAVHVSVSQAVKQGDKLVTLDCTDYQLNLEMARANLQAANARLTLFTSQLKRANEIHTKALISQEDVDIRATEVSAQKALTKQRQVGVQQAKVNTGRCTIKAPFDGIVTQRFASLGQLMRVGDPLITLLDTTNLELSTQVSYEQASLFSHVSDFTFDAGKHYSIKLHKLGGVINSQTRNQEVRFLFPSITPLSGTAGKLVWHDPRPFIPSKFIVRRDKSLGVYINAEGIASFHPLSQATPGRPSPTDLPLDTQIITKNLATVQHGQKIRAH